MKPLRVLLLAILVGAGLVASSIPVTAAVRPSATWQLTSRNIGVGSGPSAKYSVKLPTEAIAELQQQVGTAHVWRQAVRLRARAGSVQLPRLTTVGIFKYSLAIINSHHQLLYRSKVLPVYVFGTVTLAEFCQQINNVADNNCADDVGNRPVQDTSGHVQIGGTLFNIVASATTDSTDSRPTIAINSPKTTCRSAQLEVGVLSVAWNFQTPDPAPDVNMGQVVESTTNPQTVSAPAGTITPFSFTLDHGAWELEFTTNSYDGTRTYVNGTLSCYTVTGLPASQSSGE